MAEVTFTRLAEAFNEEMEFDFRRLWHWLKRFNIESCGFSLDDNGDLGFERRYHASGHASGEDITWAIEQIDPDYIVPIHTESRDWFAKSFENVFYLLRDNALILNNIYMP